VGRLPRASGGDAGADRLTVVPEPIRVQVERCTAALVDVPGVRALSLGGSWATGDARPGSDVDIGVHYRTGEPLDIDALRRAAAAVDDDGRAERVTPVGAWGLFIDGGAWLTLDGIRVDWIYRDLDRQTAAVEEGRAGRSATHFQPGHPFGFRTDIYLAELANAVALHDPHVELARLRARLDPYPETLRAQQVRGYLWDAAFSLDTAEGPGARGDVHYVAGVLFRVATCLALALLAEARVWCANEKGAVRRAAALPGAPDGFGVTVEQVLAAPGADPDALLASLYAFRELRATVAARFDQG
jgi:predicted nucleotidyltransferase